MCRLRLRASRSPCAGFPARCSDDALPWSREAASGSQLDTKYPYVCHAEMNAVLNRNAASSRGARIYATLFPCNDCAKLIIQAGIAEVVFLSDKYHDAVRECFAGRRRRSAAMTRALTDPAAKPCPRTQPLSPRAASLTSRASHSDTSSPRCGISSCASIAEGGRELHRYSLRGERERESDGAKARDSACPHTKHVRARARSSDVAATVRKPGPSAPSGAGRGAPTSRGT